MVTVAGSPWRSTSTLTSPSGAAAATSLGSSRLDSTRFRQQTGWTPPSWDEMADQVLSQPRHSLR